MSKRRAALLGPLAALFALLLTVAVPQSAGAYTTASRVTVSNSGGYCLQVDVGVDHEVPGAPFSSYTTWANAYAFQSDCRTPRNAQVRVRIELLGVESNQPWKWCGSSNWTVGTTGTNSWGPYGPGAIFDYGSTHDGEEHLSFCGQPSGDYVVEARAYVQAWHPILVFGGGGYWSGDGFASVRERVPNTLH
ncbi:hypothetical protein ACFWVC_14140 [Streptomyces sp. NPDC058691]|uniref:hypothetical protein n=1 Tax=Streptomyces sp. NPDC058691 TaxID=3346601 RepID=UPI00364F72D5